MKVGGHELKGMIAYQQAEVPELHLPLMALIDYRGFRVVAISMLPINKKKTLVYGSGDGGKTVYDTNPKVRDLMKKAAEKLNVKGHLVGPNADTEIYGPCDIEVHVGYDNRAYILDFARLFPPEAPRQNERALLPAFNPSNEEYYKSRKIGSAVLYKLLRPEFVRMYKVPLSSDAFTNFGKNGSVAHNLEVAEATQYLFDHVIPKFSKRLDAMSAQDTSDYLSIDRNLNPYGYVDYDKVRVESQLYENKNLRLQETLIVFLHREGINIRHLGLVRSHVKNPEIRQLILIEMIARLVKNVLRKKWRDQMKKQPSASEEPCKKVAVKYLNLVLGNDERSKLYWQFELKQQLCEKFLGALENHELTARCTLQDPDLLIALFTRVQELLRIQLTPPAKQFSLARLWYQRPNPLGEMDIVTIKEVIHTSNIVSFVEGLLLLNYSDQLDDPEQVKWTLLSATEKIQESLNHVPGGRKELYYMALCYYKTALLEKNVAKAISTLEMAHQVLEYVKDNYKDEIKSLLLLGKVLCFLGKLKHNKDILKSAREYFSMYLSKKQNDADAYFHSASNYFTLSLHYVGKLDLQKQLSNYQKLAVEQAKRATELDPKNYKIWHLYAKLLFKLVEIDSVSFTEICDALLRAHTLSPDNADILYLWGNVLLTRVEQTKDTDLLFLAATHIEHAIKIKESKSELLAQCGRLFNSLSTNCTPEMTDVMTKRSSFFFEIARKIDPRIDAVLDVLKISKSEIAISGSITSDTHLEYTLGKWNDHDIVLVRLKPGASTNQKKRHYNEMRYITRVSSHPNILKWYGMSDDDTHVFQYCPNRDVRVYLEQNYTTRTDSGIVTKPPWELIIKWAIQISSALSYIHKEHIVHNDVKLRHILLDSNLDAKLKGFELASTATETDIKIKSLIPNYAAPETLKTGECSPKSDVYSFGMILYEMAFCGTKRPFDELSNLSLLQLVEKILVSDLEMPEDWPYTYRIIIQSCLVADPNRRLTMSAVNKELETYYKEQRKEVTKQRNLSRSVPQDNLPAIKATRNILTTRTLSLGSKRPIITIDTESESETKASDLAES
eukprot:TRINITY_DN3612_c0_g1_i10.p1 TRINITY_DN3612_c0_g1~~TRINITY_DN3612_c0_g1_i10.p1  ORF type:complete len:1231 (+),score=183.36 TRINITY_DN3612_c0_g1_i10:494-3694(+)